MNKSKDQLVSIVSNGGGIIIDGSAYSTDQLAEISAASSGAKIIITNINSKSTDQLCKIADVSNGNVIFDLR